MMFNKLKRTYDRLRQIGWVYEELRRVSDRVEDVNNRLDIVASRWDLPDHLLLQFAEHRRTEEYKTVYYKPEPLVTVCIGTYNRADILVNRSLRSVLNQTYNNIQIIVVGDCCTDTTEKTIRSLGDSRVLFVNLPARGNYPKEPLHRWRVAGTSTVNYALSLAQGDFITHLDDDDEYTEDRIHSLVSFIQESRADLVWHPFWYENPEGAWMLNSADKFEFGKVTTSSILYHKWFARIPWDINAYMYYEPGDWNRFRKIRYLGAKTLRYGTPFLRHFREKGQLCK